MIKSNVMMAIIRNIGCYMKKTDILRCIIEIYNICKPNIYNIKHLISEYIDYHLSSESSVTQNQIYPQILSGYGDDPLNVTAQIASTITLHCLIRHLNNKTVRINLTY